MAELKVDLVSAEKSEWTGEARLVKAKSIAGDIGIMAGHAPVLAVLAPGEVVIRSSSGDTVVEVDGGFLSVDKDHVIVVVDQIVSA